MTTQAKKPADKRPGTKKGKQNRRPAPLNPGMGVPYYGVYGQVPDNVGPNSPTNPVPFADFLDWWRSIQYGANSGYGVGSNPYYPGGMDINKIYDVYGTRTLPASANPTYGQVPDNVGVSGYPGGTGGQPSAGGMPINTIKSVYGTETLPISAVPGIGGTPTGSNYLSNPLIYQTYGMAPATPPTNAPPVYIGAAGVGPAPGEGMTSQQQQQEQQAQQSSWYQYGDRMYDPNRNLYGYMGLDNNIMNSSGKLIGHVGASGLGWYKTRRGQGKNFTQIRAQAQAAGNWPQVQRMLQRRRDIMKYRGIGAGRPPETKGQIPMPGGNGNGGGSGGTQPTGQASPYNELISWQI